MDFVQLILKRYFYQLNLVLVLGGYLTLLGELIFSGHLVGSQLIGLYATILGTLVMIHGLIDVRVHKVLAVLLLLLSLFGLIGAYRHFTIREAKIALTTIQLNTNLDTESVASNGRVISPPFMSPLAISGLSLFATLTLLASKKTPQAT